MGDGILNSTINLSQTFHTPYPVAAVVPGLLLDDFPNAAIAYSFRKLRNAYAGSAVRIRRSSDNAEADIGFSGNDFDTAAAATHIGGGSGFIVTWYDQSGNSLDSTQSTAASQPPYVATGMNSLPTMEYGISSTALNTANIDLSTYMSTQGTIFSVMEQTGGTPQNVLCSWAAKLILYATYDDVIYFDFGSSGGGRVNVAQPSGWDDNPHILECYRPSNDDQAIVVDGVSLVNATRTDDITTASSPFQIGHTGGNFYFDGFISELVIWGTDLASNRANARTNINTYWSVF